MPHATRRRDLRKLLADTAADAAPADHAEAMPTAGAAPGSLRRDPRRAIRRGIARVVLMAHLARTAADWVAISNPKALRTDRGDMSVRTDAVALTWRRRHVERLTMNLTLRAAPRSSPAPTAGSAVISRRRLPRRAPTSRRGAPRRLAAAGAGRRSRPPAAMPSPSRSTSPIRTSVARGVRRRRRQRSARSPSSSTMPASPSRSRCSSTPRRTGSR